MVIVAAVKDVVHYRSIVHIAKVMARSIVRPVVVLLNVIVEYVMVVDNLNAIIAGVAAW